jgi:hypothetical protein
MATISSTTTIPPDLILQIDTDTSTGAVYVTLVTDTGRNINEPGQPADAAQLYLSRLITVSKDNNLTAALEQYTQAQTTISAAQNNAKQYQQAADAPTGTPNTNELGGTPASGDQTGDGGTTQAGAAGASTPAPGVGATVSTTSTNVTSTATTSSKLGTRLKNPLGNFSSYTYQLGLYMITPDAYDAFQLSGRTNINALTAVDSTGAATGGGAFLVAQSGGINNTVSKRAPGFELDYYIDDLKIKSKTSSKSTKTASNVTDVNFTIIEPLGFSFITNLKKAYETLKKNSKLKDYDKALNAGKQFFVLSIKFQGYDKNGNIANNSQYFSDDTRSTDPNASGVYERFYDIIIKSMKFKLAGGATTYNITASCISTSVAMGTQKAIVKNSVPVLADTVYNSLGPGTSKDGMVSLFDAMNANEKLSNPSLPNVYKLEWKGGADISIGRASMFSLADTDKKRQAMSTATNKSQVNDGTAIKTTTNQKTILNPIETGTTIPQAIKTLIMRSSYVDDAMDTLFTADEQNSEETKGPQTIKKDGPIPPLRWYNLSTRIKCLGFNTQVGDFAYEFTYVIQPYETPASVSPYGKSSKYYGPHKKYEYWFTGQNSEIISFEQSFDNTFFNVALAPDGSPEAQGNGTNVATEGQIRTGADATGAIGVGREAQNTYMTSLYDPGAYAKMKMTILGDPDYLFQETDNGVGAVYNQFYGPDGFTINPNGGQVFIEISFNEAQDYDTGTGLLSVNDSIYFWPYPPDVAAKIKGVSYMLTEVESVFSKGKFTQNLTGNVNDIPASAAAASNPSNQTAATAARTGVALTSDAGAGRGSSAFSATDPRRAGFVPDPAPSTTTTPTNLGTQPNNSVPATASGTPAAAGATQQTAPTNNPATPQVVNDDSSPAAGATQAGVAIGTVTNANIPTATDGGRENPITTSEQAIAAGA